MQPLAIKLIELLESKHLLSNDVISELRRQVAESKVKLSPELLVKLLVDNGHLTKFQATKLVAELSNQRSDAPRSTGPSNAAAVDELGFAPASNAAELVIDDAEEIVGVESVDVVEDAVSVVESADVVESIPTAFESQSGFDFDSRPSSRSSRGGMRPAAQPKSVSIAGAGANPWESFRILGVAVILGILAIVGFLLYNWMRTGSADAALKAADESYEQRNYDFSVGLYQTFATGWPSHEKASYARVRQVLSAIRKEVEGSNPTSALKKAEEQLPVIVDEPALADQSADLAHALITLAEKFANRLDSITQTDQRKEMMADMDKLMSIINDSKYVGPSQRTQQAPTLTKIEESRARILREIRRDEELALAIQQIDALLEQKEVIKAYEARKDLIMRYPVLEANEEVIKRVRQSSDIQRQLVEEVSPKTNAIADDPADSVRSFMFANKSGNDISGLEGQIAFYKVKGTVYAINVGMGQVLWSRFVGIGLDTHPVRLEETPNSDVLIAEGESGRLHRLTGDTGKKKWSVDFTESILTPAVDKEVIFVSTYSGLLYCVDAATGEAKWVKQLPQKISVSPGVVAGRKQIFQPAEHSNIYVIDKQNGSCSEVYYLGHRPGSIKVPPLLSQGILFVMENISNQAAKLRVLQPTNEGLRSVDVSKEVADLAGNVIAVPITDRTRILIQSDLGQTLILEVEPNDDKNKVSKLAGLAPNLSSPQLSWSLFNQNAVWIADKRLAKYDLQVSGGNLKSGPSQFADGLFVAPSQLFGKTILHARRLSGNQGVRITASVADTLNEVWSLDLGEPISMIVKNSGGKFGAVTSTGNYFDVSGKPVENSAKVASSGTAMKSFVSPIWISPTQAVLMNKSDSKQFGSYNEGNVPFKIMNAPLGNTSATSDGVLAGDKIVVGLDNGQLVMFDPATGALVGPPYQPALKPNAMVKWNKPVYLPASRSLVIASDMNRIVRLDTKDSLRQLSDATLENPLVGPLAIVGESIAGVRAAGAADELVMFDQTTLAISKGVPIDGKLVAGPFGGQETGLLQTNQKLVAFDAEGRIKWSVAFPNSQIVGQPTEADDKVVLATKAGVIWTINLADGVVVGNSNVGQPLSTSPFFDNGRLYLGTDEGAIIVLTALPTTVTLAGAQQ